MDLENAYQQALDYLYKFVDYSLTRNFRYTPEKFDLGRMVELMQRLGDPQMNYPVIHVAGTKGKGSTAAMIASSLHAAGYKTGFYTSPHLHDYAERIQVNRQDISHADFVELVEELRPHAEKVKQITTFELTTALGMLYFARQHVDVAVLEVGLGGRLDATNVVNPLVSVITSLSMDHMNVLGDTLAKIAAEKAGIIKPGRPVVSSLQREDARVVVEQVAAERGARLIEVGRDILFAPREHSLEGQSMLVWSATDQSLMDAYIEGETGKNWSPLCLTIPLLGRHQIDNAVTAYAALQVAKQEGLKLSEKDIQTGFANVSWPGRFEILSRKPMLVIDSAHNRDSALKLRMALDDYLTGQPVVLVFGASEDKDVPGMFAELLPRVRRVVATQSVHPRAMPADKLVELAHQFGCPAQVVPDLKQAVKRALSLAGDDCAVVAAGSLFVAAAVREVWFEMRNELETGERT